MKVKIGFLVAMLLGNGPLSASTMPGLGFGKLLKPGEHGVFFLRSLADGQGALTHPGSIALFDQGYIEP